MTNVMQSFWESHINRLVTVMSKSVAKQQSEYPNCTQVMLLVMYQADLLLEPKQIKEYAPYGEKYGLCKQKIMLGSKHFVHLLTCRTSFVSYVQDACTKENLQCIRCIMDKEGTLTVHIKI